MKSWNSLCVAMVGIWIGTVPATWASPGDKKAQAEQPAPAPAKQPATAAEAKPAADEPSGVPGANLHVDSITADGLRLSKLACKMDKGGGLFAMVGTMAIPAGIAKRKDRLDACEAGKSGSTRVKWIGVSGKMTQVQVISSPAPAAACVIKALEGAPTTVSGACAATIFHGK